MVFAFYGDNAEAVWSFHIHYRAHEKHSTIVQVRLLVGYVRVHNAALLIVHCHSEIGAGGIELYGEILFVHRFIFRSGKII